MNFLIPICILIIASVGLVTGISGHANGYKEGVAKATADHTAQDFKKLNGLLESHQGLIKQAAEASKSMRQALASRAQLDINTTKEFKDALNATADSRAGCVFDAGVMRQLSAARDRAAQAAASGIHSPVPGASASAKQP